MKTLTAAAKARITVDWLGQFPGLGQYKPLHLLRRVGPLLEGIALERTSSGDVYRPTFHVHCLAREFSTVSLTLAHPLRSERSGGPDFVSVAQHDGRYVEAATRLKRQSPLALAGALAIVDVVAAYRLFLARPGIHYDADLLYEEIARIYGWAGLLDRASATVAEGAAVMRRWPASVQEQLGGVQPWRDRVARAVAGQLQLRATADEQARLLGVGGVPVVELSV